MKTPDFGKKDWIEIGREINYNSLETELLEKHLSTPMRNVTIASSYLSRYQQVIQTAAIEKFLESEQYTVVDKLLVEEGRLRAFEYTDVEIDPDVYVQAPNRGYFFITREFNRKMERLVVHLDEYGYQRYKIWVYSRIGEQALASTFLSRLAEFSKVNNILRGKRISPSFVHIKRNASYTWESVILPDVTRQELQRNINLLLDNVEIYKKNGMTFKRGLILKGEPGTGKTLIGKILCNTLKGTTFVWVTPGDLGDPKNVKHICELARNLAPTVLFLEDIDLYGSSRERANRGILGELMNQLDGVVENEFVIVIATTNRAEELEEALRNRPGRFDRVIPIGKPDDICRRKMLAAFLSKIEIRVKDEGRLLDVLTKATDGFTGAHVKELVNSAVISAIDEKSVNADGKVVLTVDHFQANLERVKGQTIKPAGFKITGKNSDDENSDLLNDLEGRVLPDD